MKHQQLRVNKAVLTHYEQSNQKIHNAFLFTDDTVFTISKGLWNGINTIEKDKYVKNQICTYDRSWETPLREFWKLPNGNFPPEPLAGIPFSLPWESVVYWLKVEKACLKTLYTILKHYYFDWGFRVIK